MRRAGSSSSRWLGAVLAIALLGVAVGVGAFELLHGDDSPTGEVNRVEVVPSAAVAEPEATGREPGGAASPVPSAGVGSEAGPPAESVPREVATATRSGGVAREPPVPSAGGPGGVVVRTARRGDPGVETATGSAGSALPASYAFSGEGDRALGAIELPVQSILSWTNARSGSRFAIEAGGSSPISVSSSAAEGEARLDAGMAERATVRAAGPWTITIVPAG